MTGEKTIASEGILNMHRKGYTAAQIADVAGMKEEQIEDIMKLELQPA